MKMLNEAGNRIIVTQFRGLPSSNFRPDLSRPFTLSFDVDGTNPYWPHLGCDLKGDIAVDYYYAQMSDFYITQNLCDILNHVQVDATTGLSGGEFFNFVIRPQLTRKSVSG